MTFAAAPQRGPVAFCCSFSSLLSHLSHGPNSGISAEWGREGGSAIAGSRIVLVNTNDIRPPIAPIALDHLGDAVARAGYDVELADLTLAEEPDRELQKALSGGRPFLVGITFRNSDDCFWPSATSFVDRLAEVVENVRRLTDAPLVLGGAGFSVFARRIMKLTGCEFGIRGDGEAALPALARAIDRGSGFDRVPGLLTRDGEEQGGRSATGPGPAALSLGTSRSHVDNRRYFRQGGQGGLETKRGCNRSCTYCADPLIKGPCIRTRPPAEVADEVENLLRQEVDVLHLCDSEFNVPLDHARAVCEELRNRGLGEKLRWYTYASVTPFPGELARLMKEAGCAGVNFGADSAHPGMLERYGRRHRREDIAGAVKNCRRHGLSVMLDLLLGGPGETEQSVRDTIEFMKKVDPDCVGAALGVRLYPGTDLAARVAREEGFRGNPNLRGPDADPEADDCADEPDLATRLLQPTFYVSGGLGEAPARFVKDLIAGDERFFEPQPEGAAENYNYTRNELLADAIRDGARGAYWDILRRLRSSGR